MIDLDKWNGGVVVRPGGGSMVVEIIRLARQIRCGYVGGYDLAKISDSARRNNVPEELRPRRTIDTARRVKDGDLASIGRLELAEIAFQHILRRNCGEQPSIPQAREIQAQAAEEKGLIVAVINMRNNHRPTEGKPAFVITDGLPLLRSEQSRVQLVIL